MLHIGRVIPNSIRRRPCSRTVAVCDLGTFSGLILIADCARSHLTSCIEEKHTIDLLSGFEKDRRLRATALERAVGVVKRFERTARDLGVTRAAVVCTSAVREAPNGKQFAESLREVTKYPVRVLTARQEAGFSAMGAMTGLRSSSRPAVMVDIGGGSTEVVFRKGGRNRLWLADCGAVRATHDWERSARRPSGKRMVHYSVRAATVMRDLPTGGRQPWRVIGVGGTIVTLAGISAGLNLFDSHRLHGRVLTTEWIVGMAGRLAAMDRRAIARLIPFDATRARVLTAGTFLWAGVLNRLGADRVVVSVRGLRWGVAARLSQRGRL